MLCQSTFFFVSLLLFGLISAYPSTRDNSESIDRAAVKSSLKNGVPPAISPRTILDPNQMGGSSKEFPVAIVARVTRRAFFGSGRKTSKEGTTCDGTFYKQSRVSEVTANSCLQAAAAKTGGPSSKLGNTFVASTKPYSGPANLFPGQSGLRMTRLTNGFFSASQISSFLRFKSTSKGTDYIITDSKCRTLAIARETAPGKLTFCSGSAGPAAQKKTA